MNERTCIVTRKAMPAAALLRFVLGPEATPVLDLKGTLPGRGVWVTVRAWAVRDAVRKGLFQRAFKAPVTVDETLVEQVAGLLEARCLNYLSLARKAGLVHLGFVKAKLAISQGADVMVIASDASQQGAKKILAGTGPELTRISCFDSLQLGLAFGRSSVVHAALGKHGLTGEFLLAAARLTGYLDTPDQANAD